MPLFPRIPQPVTDGEGTDVKKGKGYEWIITKFVELADNIRQLREQGEYEEDAGELAKDIMTVTPEGTKFGIRAHSPVKPGVELRVERVVAISGNAANSVTLYSDPSCAAQHLIGVVQTNIAGAEGPGQVAQVGSFNPNIPIVLRPGEALSFATNVSANGEPVTILVWFRRISEKPQGLAVG